MTENNVRSRTMRAIKSKNTKPEMTVRRMVHGMGYRFRLHLKDLPGSPDLVFPSRMKVVWVHGCFWHGHNCKRGARQPKTNVKYWSAKIERNMQRDSNSVEILKRMGWSSLVIWECTLKFPEVVKLEIRAFLSETKRA